MRVLCSKEIDAIKSVKIIIAIMTKNADSKIRSRTVSLKVFFEMARILVSMAVEVRKLERYSLGKRWVKY